jgi:hypothetical protein
MHQIRSSTDIRRASLCDGSSDLERPWIAGLRADQGLGFRIEVINPFADCPRLEIYSGLWQNSGHQRPKTGGELA